MRSEHVLRSFCSPRDFVDIERRGIGGEHRPRLCHAIEIGEDPLFEVHLLEHRLDHEIGGTYRIEFGDPVDQRYTTLHVVGPEPAARNGGAVVGCDTVEALLQEVGAGLDDRDRDAGIGEAHRDATAHRAGADDRARHNGARLCSLWDTGHPCRLALGKENVTLRFGLIAGNELAEQFAFALQPFLKREGNGVAHGLDAGGRRIAAAQPPGQRFGGIGKALRDKLVFAVADEPQRPPFGHDTAGKDDRTLGQVAFDDFVDDPVRQRFPSLDRVAGDDHLERLFGSDQARQALGAAGAGQEPELDLGQADARPGNGNAEMAGKRHLEPAAEGRPVKCRYHRLWHRLDHRDDLGEARRLRRLAEFGDVGAGEKGASGAGDDHGLDRRVLASLAQRLGEAGADLVLERVDWGVVGGDDRDLAVLAEIDAGVDVAHNGLGFWRVIPETSLTSPCDEARNRERLSLTKIVKVGRFIGENCHRLRGED